MIWADCDGEKHIGCIQGLLFRLVESQQQVATLSFVDTLEEQALLEDLLETSKPPQVAASENLHYLLRTPFRYPPLKWGSRFGRTHEPGIFYGGLTVEVTLAEAAFYRFFFWRSMDATPVNPSIRTQHTLFSARYKTDRGVRLQAPPFDEHRNALTDRERYGACQALGTAMRDAGVDAFEFASARHAAHGTCFGAFQPTVFTRKKPLDAQSWLCELSADEVTFKPLGDNAITRFTLGDFLVDGRFPSPA